MSDGGTASGVDLSSRQLAQKAEAGARISPVDSVLFIYILCVRLVKFKEFSNILSVVTTRTNHFDTQEHQAAMRSTLCAGIVAVIVGISTVQVVAMPGYSL